MQFQVPQFIEVEDKIFGPLTLKQFFYLLGGAAGVFLLYAVLPFFLVIFLAPPIAAFFLALAFYKIHGQPFVKVAENAFRHFTRNKIYTWKKSDLQQPQFTLETTKQKKEPETLPKIQKSKLSDLAWSLDIKQKTKQQ